MNQRILRVILTALTAAAAGIAHNNDAHAGEPLVLAPGKGVVRIYGGTTGVDHYYDLNGQMKRFDTLHTQFRATVFGIDASYGLVNNLELNVDVPVGYFSVSSDARFPKRSIFSPVYYGIGANYQLGRGKLNASLSTMLKVPSGFHNGIYDDPAHPSFLSDGYFQLTTALNFGFTVNDVWFKGSAGYNWRDEEPADEIIYHAEVGLSRIEGTGIFLGCDGVVSMADVTHPLEPFYAGASGSSDELSRIDGGRGTFRTIDRENYFAVRGGAFVGLSDRVTLSGNCSIRLFGTNSLDMAGGSFALAYNF